MRMLIKEAMLRMATDRDLRCQLSEGGMAYARTLTWRKTAREILDVLHEAGH